MKVYWSDRFSIGVEFFDAQHRRLFEMINTLLDAIKTGKGREILVEIFDGLLEYAGTHFAEEERVMQNSGFSGYQQHVDEHKNFVDNLNVYYTGYLSGKPVIKDMVSFLLRWLMFHIEKSDKQYGAHLVAIQERVKQKADGGPKSPAQLRRKVRYKVRHLHLQGRLILYPDPRHITVEFDDISESGSGVAVISPLVDEQKRELEDLVKAAKSGNHIPVQLVCNSVKIPVVVVNMLSEERYGLMITESGHSKLSALADKGRQSFQEIIQMALKKGAEQAGFVDYPILSREFLPQNIKDFVEDKTFMSKLIPYLTSRIIASYPLLDGKVTTPADKTKIFGLLIRFLHKIGKDILLITGTSLLHISGKNKDKSLDDLLKDAINDIVDTGKLLSKEDSAAFRDILAKDFLAKKMPALFVDLPDRHTISEIIKMRFNAFNSQKFFIQGLGQKVCEHYLGIYKDRKSEIAQYFVADQKLVKTTLMRWIQNELNQLGRSGPNQVNVIEEYFKQAMYEYILRQKSSNITFDETCDIYDGRLPATLMDIRDKFLGSVCKIMDASLEEKFEDYRHENDEEMAKKIAERDEAIRIAKMNQTALIKKFCWPKIVDIGRISKYQREIAKDALSADQYHGITSLGCVIAIPGYGYEELQQFAAEVGKRPSALAEYFTVVDFADLYNRKTRLGDGTEKRDVFGLYIDSMYPIKAREMVLDKVINSPQWSKVFVLNKSKAIVGKAFGLSANKFFEILEAHMLSNPVCQETMV